jgi:tetratricopeptide (TPR) repeat protein
MLKKNKTVYKSFTDRFGQKVYKPLLILTVIVSFIVIALFLWFGSYVSQDEHLAVVKKVDQQIIARDFGNAEKTLNNHLSMRLRREYRTEAEALMASLFVSQGNDQKALEWYKRAESTSDGKERIVILGLAQTYVSLGNNSEAINYYRKAIDLTRNDGVAFNDSYIPGYEEIIKKLEDPNYRPPTAASDTPEPLPENLPAPSLSPEQQAEFERQLRGE